MEEVTDEDPLMGYLIVDGEKIPVLAQKDPAKIPWAKYGVEMVVEATGKFTSEEDAKKHAEALSQEEIAIFLTHGDVDFSQSNVEHEGGKLYVIHGKDGKQQNMTFEIINYTDKAVLKKIIYN